MNLSRRKFLPLLGAGITLPGLLSFSAEGTQQKIILPSRLKNGDTIAVTSPAGALRDSSTARKFKTKLESLGFNVIMGETVSSRYGYLSGSDDLRLEELLKFFADPKVDAIVCMKGGYGCMRIVDRIDYDLIRNNPKIFMGFSDITVLLNAIYKRTGLITFHGPVGNSSWNDFSLRYMNSVLMHAHPTVFKGGENPEAAFRIIRGGSAEGFLAGGNLSVLTGMIGTPFLPDLKGAVLFLEEVKEEPFRIDRMLAQLRLAGILDNLAGVILGQFRDCVAEEPDFAFTVDEVIQQYFGNAPYPVIANAAIGHVADKFTLPVGGRVRLDADQKQFRLVSPVVV